jgi:hypothetical protein
VAQIRGVLNFWGGVWCLFEVFFSRAEKTQILGYRAAQEEFPSGAEGRGYSVDKSL